jgi:AraC-like DNA-binding protein
MRIGRIPIPPGRLRSSSAAPHASRLMTRGSALTRESCSCWSPRRCTPGWPQYRRVGRTRSSMSLRTCSPSGPSRTRRLRVALDGWCSATGLCGRSSYTRTGRSSTVTGSPWRWPCSARSTSCAHTSARALRRHAVAMSTRRCAELARTWPNGPDRVSLADLSTVAGLSRFELVRRFRADTGMPPHAFQIDLRIGRARRMLAAGEAPAAVAASCGFADQAHLTRTFRRSVGVTPARFARA